jgi:hypothetical protein
MTVELEIRDGNPWWLSPNIWTVPGNDPEGPIGIPIVGGPCYIWTRVTNNGTDPVQDARVRFYWANPGVGFDRTTATSVGISSVTLQAGESQDVLCLAPWHVTFVNEGHECVLAEAFHPSDPLPLIADFKVPIDRHVAQRNLNVIKTSNHMFHFSFEVYNTLRGERIFKVLAHQDSLRKVVEQFPWIPKTIELPQNEIKVQSIGFSYNRNPVFNPLTMEKESIDIKVDPNSRKGLTLVGTLNERGVALLHLEQWTDGKLIGGISIIVINEGDE